MPPITLTRQQFLQKRPGGHYQNYLGFVNKRRAARTAVAAADPLTALTSSLQASIQSPAAIAKSSAQAVADAISQQTAGVQAAYKQQQADLGTQATRAQGFAEAMARLTAPDPAAIGAQYRESADRLRAYGTGLTGAVAEAQQANADKARAAVSQVLGEPADVHGYDPAALRNVAQMTNIVNPGDTLEAQARDAVARAAYGRAASNANVGAISQGFLQKQGDLTTQIADKIREIEASRPTLLRQELASEQGQARQNVATAISALALQATNAQKGAQTGAIKAGYTGKQPGTNKPTPTTWRNPATGVMEKIPSGTTIKKVNGVLTPVPVGSTVVTNVKTGKQRIVPNKAPGSGRGKDGSVTSKQSKTLADGTVVDFNPKAPAGQRYTDPTTGNPVDPNDHKASKTKLTPDKVRTYRASALTGIAQALVDNPKILPSVLYRNGVAQGTPGWIAAWALRKEAKKHPDDPVWQNWKP